LKGLSNVAQIH